MREKHLRRSAGWIGLAAFVLAIAGVAGATVIQARQSPTGAGGAVVAPAPTDTSAAAERAAAPLGTASEPASAAPLTIAVAEGETVLGDGLIAVRTGSTVTVSFDTPLTRTRRRDKFERVVRTTLPAVYGPKADSLLATIPTGSLVGAADLLGDLPTRGLRVPLADGWALTLWPATRAGRDGPLVVSYRSTLAR